MDDHELLESTHDTVIQLKTLLVGANGAEGLIGEIKTIKVNVKELNSRHNKLNVRFWTLVSFLVGSGILGFGAWGFFK